MAKEEERPKVGILFLEPDIVERPLVRWSCCPQILDELTLRQLRAKESPMFHPPGQKKKKTGEANWSKLLTWKPASSCLISATLSCVEAHRKLKEQGSENVLCWDVVRHRFSDDTDLHVGTSTYCTRWSSKLRKVLFGRPQHAAVQEREGDAVAFVLNKEKLVNSDMPQALVRVEGPRTYLLMELLDKFPVIAALTCRPGDSDQFTMQPRTGDRVYCGVEPSPSKLPWDIVRCVVLAGYVVSSAGSYWIAFDAFEAGGGFFKVPIGAGELAGFFSFAFIPAV